MVERDVRLGIEVVGAPEAKAQLDSLKQSTDSLSAENAAVATSATAAAAATTQQTAATAGQVVQENAVIIALKEARASMTALAAASSEGGVVMTAALGRAAIAVAALEAEIIATQARGGVVSAAQMAGLDTYKARLAELTLGLRTTGASTEFAAGHSRLLTTATTQAANAIVGKSVQVGALGGALLRLVTGPIGLFITAVTLLPSLIKIVTDTVGNWSTKIGETIAGLNEQDGVLRKSGESTEAYTARANRAADAQALFERASYAAIAGVIANEASVERLTARYILHEEALRAGRFTTEQLAAAYKTLGIAQAESLKFEDARNNIATFFALYDAELKKGQNAARLFADANKSQIERWMQSYEDAGQAIPARLLEIAKAHDVMTRAQELAAKNTKELAEMQKLADEDARKFGITTDELARIMQRYGSVAAAAAAGALDLDPGFIKISTGASVAKGSIDDLLDALNSLSASTQRFDEVSERAFDVGDEGEE